MKLQSNELRCTNLVTDNKGLEAYKISELYYGDKDHQTGIAWNIDTPIEGICIERFNPIPLTEEWLLKLGFEKDGFDIALLMQKARLGFIYYGGLPHQLDIIQDGKQLAMSANCAIYVHQLQNLYFVLTGTELTIKQ